MFSPHRLAQRALSLLGASLLMLVLLTATSAAAASPSASQRLERQLKDANRVARQVCRRSQATRRCKTARKRVRTIGARLRALDPQAPGAASATPAAMKPAAAPVGAATPEVAPSSETSWFGVAAVSGAQSPAPAPAPVAATASPTAEPVEPTAPAQRPTLEEAPASAPTAEPTVVASPAPDPTAAPAAAPTATPEPSPAVDQADITAGRPRSAVWTPLAEPGVGGWMTSVAVSPFDPNRMLLGGDMLGVGLSTDGGQVWKGTTGFASWEINDFTWDPVDPQAVWVGTMSGPYRSTDGGATWTPMREGLPTGDYPYSAPVQKVLVDPSNSDSLLAFGGNRREHWKARTDALNYGAVYASRDGGRTWSTVGSVGSDVNVLDAVTTGPGLRDVFVAALGRGVLRSSDGGRTWTPADTGLPSDAVKDIEVDPDHRGTMWAALATYKDPAATGKWLPGGIYKSVDAGATWREVGAGLPHVASTSVQATSMRSVYRAGNGVLYTADQGYSGQRTYLSRDGGATWVRAFTAVDRAFPASSAPVVWGGDATGTRILGGTTDSVIGTADGGRSWSDVGAYQVGSGWRGRGYSGLLGTSIAFSTARPGLVLLSAFDAGNVMRSDDAGSSWNRAVRSYDQYGGGYDTAIGGRDGSVAFAVLGQQGTFNGLLASTDAGQTWTAGAGVPARGTVGSGGGDVAIASESGSDAWAVLPDRKLYRTTDFGRTWSAVAIAAVPTAVEADARTGTVWIGTTTGVYRRDAGAAPVLIPASPTNVTRLRRDARGRLLAIGKQVVTGVWRLDGASWQLLLRSTRASDVAVDPSDTRRVAVATNDDPYHDVSLATGVWVSGDDGSSFSQVNTGLAMTRILTVSFDPSRPGRLVAGTNGRGFWQVDLP